MVFSVSNVVIQSSINSFGSSIIVAGNSAGANLENFVYIGMSAFTQATITFTSQNAGAHNYKAIKRILWLTLILATISALLVSVVVWVFGNTFLGLYTNEPAVKEVGMIRLTYVTLWLALNGVLGHFCQFDAWEWDIQRCQRLSCPSASAGFVWFGSGRYLQLILVWKSSIFVFQSVGSFVRSFSLFCGITRIAILFDSMKWLHKHLSIRCFF